MLSIKRSYMPAWIVLAVFGSDLLARINMFIGESNGSTAVVLSVQVCVALMIFWLVASVRWQCVLTPAARMILVATLIWNATTFVRGVFRVEDYWSTKVLITTHSFMLLMPLFIVLSVNPVWFRKSLSFLLFYIFPASALLIPLSLSFDTELFSRAVIPVALFVLLLPIIARRYWILILGIAVLSFLMDPSYRSNSLRLAVVTLLALVGIIALPLGRKLLNVIWVVAAVAPLIFMGLGVTGEFNVFSDAVAVDATIEVVEGGEIREVAIGADTRSFLYEEVLGSMMGRGESFLIGQGAGTGYDSYFFQDMVVSSAGRFGAEVGFLNVLMYSGGVGVALYAGLLLLAAFQAFNHSSSRCCKTLGLYLVFKWLLFFVEDMQKLDLNCMFGWVVVGLCLSKWFRQLSDKQLRAFFAELRVPWRLGSLSR